MLNKNLLFETIKVEDGKTFNLQWHNKRFNKSRSELFNAKSSLDLKHYISPPSVGLYRCKIIYNQNIQSIEYFPYRAKTFQSFKVVQSQIQYAYKYAKRNELESLLDFNYDEIIIEKNGLLTDTSIANIAFLDGDTWVTPAKPLLYGTTRARLLADGFLKVNDITKESIKNYSHFALMNSMIGFRIQTSANIET